MAKNQNWQLKDLVDKGLRLNESTGTYEKAVDSKSIFERADKDTNTPGNVGGIPQANISKLPDVEWFPLKTKRRRRTKNESTVRDTWERLGRCVWITLAGLSPGLNGKDGLMREHFREVTKRRNSYRARLENMKVPKFNCQIQVTFTRHTCRLMDWDNAGASFKSIGDALRIAGVIIDDSPLWIVNFIPKQVKCRRADQKMEILIEPIGELPL